LNASRFQKSIGWLFNSGSDRLITNPKIPDPVEQQQNKNWQPFRDQDIEGRGKSALGKKCLPF
jgi:hypothetical protein